MLFTSACKRAEVEPTAVAARVNTDGDSGAILIVNVSLVSPNRLLARMFTRKVPALIGLPESLRFSVK